MPSRTHHEQISRGREVMQKLAGAAIYLCGAGALGSNIAVNLARIGFSALTVVDRDRVEEHNIGTQTYSQEDVGGLKAELLRNMIYRDTGIEIKAHAKELTDRTVDKLLKDALVVVDVFDNSVSRRLVKDYCAAHGIECLHAGVNDQYAEIVWNESYSVPSDQVEDACNYPLTRVLILLVCAVASESLVRFVANGTKRNYSVTLGDLSINEEKDLD